MNYLIELSNKILPDVKNILLNYKDIEEINYWLADNSYSEYLFYEDEDFIHNYSVLYIAKVLIYNLMEKHFNEISSVESYLKNSANQLVTDYLKSIPQYDIENIIQFFEYFFAKKHMKKIGAYFTPEWIVKYMIDEVSPKAYQAVLEPSCGHGLFLKSLHEYDVNQNKTSTMHLCGIDIDCFLVQFSKLLSFFYDNEKIEVIQDNSLLLDSNDLPKKFDIIIGNPPYGLKFSNEEKKKYSIVFKDTWSKKYDSFGCFIEKSLSLLKEGGKLSFIIPSTLLSIDTFEKLRKYILNTCKIISITDFGYHIFENATVSTSVIVLEKCSTESERLKHITKYKQLAQYPSILEKQLHLNDSFVELKQEDFFKNPKNQFLLYKNDLHNVVLLKDICEIKIAARSTEYTTNNQKNITVSHISKSNHVPLLKGRNNNKWFIDEQSEHTGLYICKDDIPLIKNGLYLNEKIIVSHTQGNRIMASLDSSEHPWTGDVFIVKTKMKGFHLYYVLGILNSSFLQNYHQNNYQETTPHLIKTALEHFPIPLVDESTQIEIVNLVDNYLKTKNSNYLAIMNDLINKLY